MSITTSIEEFLAAVEAAEQRLASGEEKARRAKGLLLQAEKARDEAAARRSEAQRQLAAIEAAMGKARTLRAILGDETLSQGQALLEQVQEEAQAGVGRLTAQAEEAQAEVERLLADPEIQAYLDYREAQAQAEREAQKQTQRSLEARLSALRPGVAIGQGAEELTKLAAEAEKDGFSNLAAQARDAAKGAHRMAQAQAQAEAALRKRSLTRWAERQARQAQPGDFVYVLEEAGDTRGVAVHLRSLPAQSGRIRFQVISTWKMEGAPAEYGDVPAHGRVWRWRKPPTGEPEGLTEAQAKVVAQIVQGNIRSGWAINRANARLGRQAAEERKAAHEAEAARRVAEAAETEAELVVESQPEASVQVEAEAETQAGGQAEEDGLEGLSPRVTARLQRVGLNTRQSVEEIVTAGETAFLVLPGIGLATLAAVQEWLEDEDVEEVKEVEAATEALASEEIQTQVEAEPPREAESESESLVEDQPATTRADDETKSQGNVVSVPSAPIILVEGSDEVSGQRLAGWRGAALVGLTPMARRLGLGQIQVLVCEEQKQATLLAYWPGGEAEISCPADGPAGQKKAIRKVIAAIKSQQEIQVQVSA